MPLLLHRGCEVCAGKSLLSSGGGMFTNVGRGRYFSRGNWDGVGILVEGIGMGQVFQWKELGRGRYFSRGNWVGAGISVEGIGQGHVF